LPYEKELNNYHYASAIKSVVIKNKVYYIFLVESFLVESTITLEESFLVESTITLEESTFVESAAGVVEAPLLQAAKEAIARTNNNFFIF
jgi:hypothetical protein